MNLDLTLRLRAVRGEYDATGPEYCRVVLKTGAVRGDTLELVVGAEVQDSAAVR